MISLLIDYLSANLLCQINALPYWEMVAGVRHWLNYSYDNGHPINWWMRSAEALHHLKTKGHNPHYLSMVEYNVDNIVFYENMAEAVQAADLVVIGIPSAFIADALQVLPKDSFLNKNILSAIKGILPEQALLLMNISMKLLVF